MNMVPLGELMPSRIPSLDPARHPAETFELWSIPAFDSGAPEVLQGSEIGSSKKCVEPGDVLLSRIVPHIRRSWVVGPMNGHRQIASGEWITFRSDRLFPNYLRHILTSDPFHREFMQTVAGVGGSLLRARPEGVKLVQIPLPPLEEQKRIAAILDQADALRRLRRRALDRLSTLGQAIFHEMFGDARTNPYGHPIASVGEICRLINGRAFKPEEWEDTGLPIIRIQNLNDAAKPFNYTSKNLPNKFRVREGDYLFSWSGTPGTSFGCFRWSGPEGWLNQHIFKVIVTDAILGTFFRFQLNARLDELIAKAHGGVGLQHVTKGMVTEMPFICPSIEVQEAFVKRVRAAESIEEFQCGARAKVGALFTSLQHRAFRGEL